MLAGAAGAALLGLPYLLRAFGPTEAEVVAWGRVSLALGVSLLLLVAALGRCPARAARALLAAGFALAVLLQVPPIVLWPLFHGTGISDGSPPSAFVAHWAYALPHLALLALSLGISWDLARPRSGAGDGSSPGA